MHATALATAAGVTLGPLLAVADAPLSAYPFVAPQDGTFGNGHFCGKVRNMKTVAGPNGIRRRVPAKGTHRSCRVPGSVVASVSLTYALAG